MIKVIPIKMRMTLIHHEPHQWFTTFDDSCQQFPLGLIMKLAGRLMKFREKRKDNITMMIVSSKIAKVRKLQK